MRDHIDTRHLLHGLVRVYKGKGRGDTIRTCDIQLPKLALYQAELRPEENNIIHVPHFYTIMKERFLSMICA